MKAESAFFFISFRDGEKKRFILSELYLPRGILGIRIIRIRIEVGEKKKSPYSKLPPDKAVPGRVANGLKALAETKDWLFFWLVLEKVLLRCGAPKWRIGGKLYYSTIPFIHSRRWLWHENAHVKLVRVPSKLDGGGGILMNALTGRRGGGGDIEEEEGSLSLSSRNFGHIPPFAWGEGKVVVERSGATWQEF